MPNLGCPAHDAFDSRAFQHAHSPVICMRPFLDVNAKKFKHPRHGKGEVGQVRQRRAVTQRNILLTRLRQATLKDVPLFDYVLVKPARYIRDVSADNRIVTEKAHFSMVRGSCTGFARVG